MDIFIISAFLNTVWYIITLLVLLYKFTSIFSYIYNFAKFTGTLYSFVSNTCHNLYSYIRQKRGYIKIGSDETEYILPQNRNDIDVNSELSEEETPASFFEKSVNYISDTYTHWSNKIFGKNTSSNYIPEIEHISIDVIKDNKDNKNNKHTHILSKNVLEHLDQSYNSEYYNSKDYNLMDFNSRAYNNSSFINNFDNGKKNSYQESTKYERDSFMSDSNLLLESTFINQNLNVKMYNSSEHPLMD